MNIFELFKISLRALLSNKLRSILTMLGIIIGVAAVIIMVAIGNGAARDITSSIQGLGSNLLTIYPSYSNTGGIMGGFGSGDTLKMSDVPKLKEAGDAVKAVAPVADSGAQVVYGSGNAHASVTGTTADYASIRNLEMAQGRFLTDKDVEEASRVAVVGSMVVENLLGDPNAEIVGLNIKLNDVPFLVVGVVESQGDYSTDETIFAPISAVQERLTGDKSLWQIFVEAASAEAMSEAQEQVTYALQVAHKISPGQENDFEIVNQSEILETMEEVTRTLSLLLGGIAGISLFVGGIGVMNIMLVSVTERTREIGIRKAIGAKGRAILSQFLIEAITLSLIGGLIGILLGWGGARIANDFMGVSAVVTWDSVGIAFGFSALIGIVFGVVPARKAAAMHPIEALRYE